MASTDATPAAPDSALADLGAGLDALQDASGGRTPLARTLLARASTRPTSNPPTCCRARWTSGTACTSSGSRAPS
jgi:hypothetical protein